MITHYLDEILKPKLKKLGVSDAFCNHTTEIVKKQIISLVAHWDDVAFRKAVLLIGMEEGLFYEPSAKVDVKAFVVVTIRNSPIETLQSNLYAKTGLKAELTAKEIKSITSDAIRYFNSLNFSELCKYAKQAVTDDYYYRILNNHPVTKTALEKLSAATSKSVVYKPVEFSKPYMLPQLTVFSKDENPEMTMTRVVMDGYSTEIDSELYKILQSYTCERQGVFVSDSFKFVTRNFEKLIKILEFLLTHNISFVTPNFYLENGCVERRTNLLKASHTVDEMIIKLNQTAGLSFKHKTALKAFMKNN